jgi:hypothetical protein
MLVKENILLNTDKIADKAITSELAVDNKQLWAIFFVSWQ